MLVLRCRDMGFECEEVMRGQTEERLLQLAAKHALRTHGVKLTLDLAEQVKPYIFDEEKMAPTSQEGRA
jgi:predicted small metal-binding protein